MTGILDTVKFAGVLVLAIPPALAGLELLVVRGQTLTGGALITLAILLVLVQQRLTTPGDVPGLVARRLVGTVTDEPESESDERS
ncbi:DUF7533 family protein [Natronobacterium texcoconense]|uniref:Uncharacterized protein n=1 Tax=Natronobacterium texcoconense TaxID=1095778 RepID=A0A1H1IRX0_NATTX|nr:hypothetical protein [Natronobacterium texcoconense]SDR40413.1 hypothetical protein SAMN04489842_3766 [Natronobacterium texcoconense]